MPGEALKFPVPFGLLLLLVISVGAAITGLVESSPVFAALGIIGTVFCLVQFVRWIKALQRDSDREGK